MPNICDKCPASAAVSFLSPNDGSVLLFCEHHSTEYQPALTDYLSYPVAGTELYPPRGWESSGFGLPVNGPKYGHSRVRGLEYDRWENES